MHTMSSAAQVSAHGIIVAKMVRAHIPPLLWRLLLSCHDMADCYIYLFIYLFFAVRQPRWGEVIKVENKEEKSSVYPPTLC